jgi:hypothetical protein
MIPLVCIKFVLFVGNTLSVDRLGPLLLAF